MPTDSSRRASGGSVGPYGRSGSTRDHAPSIRVVPVESARYVRLRWCVLSRPGPAIVDWRPGRRLPRVSRSRRRRAGLVGVSTRAGTRTSSPVSPRAPAVSERASSASTGRRRPILHDGLRRACLPRRRHLREQPHRVGAHTERGHHRCARRDILLDLGIRRRFVGRFNALLVSGKQMTDGGGAVRPTDRGREGDPEPGPLFRADGLDPRDRRAAARGGATTREASGGCAAFGRPGKSAKSTSEEEAEGYVRDLLGTLEADPERGR